MDDEVGDELRDEDGAAAATWEDDAATADADECDDCAVCRCNE